MKKILIISSLVIFVLFAVLVSVPFWVDVNKYKDHIVNLIKAKSGREINIGGEITLNVIPNISLTLNDVSLASPLKDEGNIFTSSKFILKVKILPLFHKKLEVDSFKLVDPKFSLHVLANGKNNWVESKPVHIEDTTALQPKATAVESKSDMSDTGVEVSKSDIAPDQPVDIVQNDEDSSFDGQVEPVGQSKLANLIFNKIQVVNGSFNFIDDKSGRKINVSTINLNTSLQPGGNPFELSGKLDIFEDAGKGVFKINGQYFVGDSQYGLDGVTLNLDGIEAFINSIADMETYKPTFKMSLYMGNIDFNNYKIASANAGGVSAGKGDDSTTFSWSDELIDFSFIHKFDLNFNFKTSGVKYKDISTGEIMVNAYIRNNQFIVNMKDTKLFGGNINGDVTIDSSIGNQNIRGNLKIEHVDFSQLPKKNERINLAAGIANAEIKLTSSGNSQKTIVGNLNGSANINTTNIGLEGIDIFSMVNNVVSAFDIGHANNKTVFKEISADFAVRQGVLNNDNGALKSDVMNLTGAGEINLNDLTVNYKLTPQYAQEDIEKRGLAVPVVITGSLFSPQFRLEVKSLVRDLINNPKGPENLVKQLKRDLKGAKENFKKEDVINNLKGMFQ